MRESSCGDSSEIPESERRVKAQCEFSPEQISAQLEAQTLEGLLNNASFLQERGIYPFASQKGPNFFSQEVFAVFVHKIFQDYRKQKAEDPHYAEASDQAKQMRYLLVLASKLVPILMGDWEVDRVKKAENALGLKSFQAFEQVIAEHYRPADGVLRHLEKGVGNGEAMHARQEYNAQLPPSQRFEQYGVADKAYYPLERVITQFIKPECRDREEVQQLARFLGMALRQTLKSRWYKAEGNVLREWKAQVPFFDLNEVYELLRNPRPWLSEWYDRSSGYYHISREFENDNKRKLTEPVHRLFLEFEGFSPEEIDEILVGSRRESLLDEEDMVLEELSLLREIRDRADELLTQKCDLRKRHDDMAVFAASVASFHPNFEGVRNTLDFLTSLHETNEFFLQKLKEIREQKAEIPESGPILKKTSGRTPAQQKKRSLEALGRFFDRSFVKGIRSLKKNSERSGRPDLNKYTSAFLENVILDTFENISNHFPPQSFSVITSIRGDSHETDEAFERDIEANLELLQPGGCLLTDGHRESYTRVNRFEQIRRVLEQKGSGYKAEVVVDRDTGQPISLLIQRQYQADVSKGPLVNDGYFTDEQKSQCFQEHVAFESLDTVIENPYYGKVLNTIRRNIRDAVNTADNTQTVSSSRSKVDAFRGIHDSLRDQVDMVLAATVIESLPEEQLQQIFGPGFSYRAKEKTFSTTYHTQEFYSRLIMAIGKNEVEVANDIVEKVLNEVQANLRAAA